MQPKHDGQIFCPRDGVPMAKVNDRGQTIDVCPHCRGKWLDEGEMEAILAALSVMPGFSVQRLQSHHGGQHGIITLFLAPAGLIFIASIPENNDIIYFMFRQKPGFRQAAIYYRNEYKGVIVVGDIPRLEFDEATARIFFPRPVPKNALLFAPPIPEGGGEQATNIRPKWGGVQSFFGQFYIVGSGSEVGYGSAKIQWELMHRQIDPERLPALWVKVTPVMAYLATGRAMLYTFVHDPSGGTRETGVEVSPGDWVVQQVGLEVQRIEPSDFSRLYFTEQEAADLGLTRETFDQWAIRQARESILLG